MYEAKRCLHLVHGHWLYRELSFHGHTHVESCIVSDTNTLPQHIPQLVRVTVIALPELDAVARVAIDNVETQAVPLELDLAAGADPPRLLRDVVAVPGIRNDSISRRQTRIETLVVVADQEPSRLLPVDGKVEAAGLYARVPGRTGLATHRGPLTRTPGRRSG